MSNTTTEKQNLVADMFGVSIDRVKQQYAGNADQLEKMAAKALQTGKKVNKYTYEELKASAQRYRELSK